MATNISGLIPCGCLTAVGEGLTVLISFHPFWWKDTRCEAFSCCVRYFNIHMGYNNTQVSKTLLQKCTSRRKTVRFVMSPRSCRNFFKSLKLVLTVMPSALNLKLYTYYHLLYQRSIATDHDLHLVHQSAGCAGSKQWRALQEKWSLA